MSDGHEAIIETLRADLASALFYGREWRDKARDKIAEVELLERSEDALSTKVLALEAELAKIREALERIAAPGSVDLADIADDDAAAAFMATALRNVKDIARAALADQQEEK